MNHRLLVTGTLGVGDPARALVTAALTEITGVDAAVFDERLTEDTPWLLDLPTVEEAMALSQWIFSEAGMKTGIVPAVGVPAPSRAAGLALLARRSAEGSRRKEASDAAEREALGRRHAEAKERARALATERGPSASSPSGGQRPESGKMEQVLGAGPITGPRTVFRRPEDLAEPSLDLKSERSPMLRFGGVAVVVLALAWGVGPRVVVPWQRGRLQDNLAANLRSLDNAATLGEREVRQACAAALRDGDYDPKDFEILVFLAPDAEAAGLEADRGMGVRKPENGLRVRARLVGPVSFLGRHLTVDVTGDVLLRASTDFLTVVPYTSDFITVGEVSP